MGVHVAQKDLFSYGIDLDRRIRSDHPLRRVLAAIDFRFVRAETARFYGYNGNVSLDPVVVMKLMFVLFFDNVRSERELMRMLPERLDYLWFLGFTLEDEIPDHSVLSKARARWGKEVFERLFVRTVEQCVKAGLVEGTKIHMDGSLVDAHASRDSVVRSSPELISALKKAYAVEETKLEGNLGYPNYEPVNDTIVSTTDPDASIVRQKQNGDSRPRYKHHRAVDDKCGVITAVETTPGDIEENRKAEDLVDQHERNTGAKVGAVVADQQYGTVDNYRRLQKRGIATHMAPLRGGKTPTESDVFPRTAFKYDSLNDQYTCPGGQKLYPRRFDPRRQATEYVTRKGTCSGCALKSQCTRSQSHGRTIMRHLDHELVERGIEQARTDVARRDRLRRRHLIEGSFADAANLHHFKKSRWRRLARQQVQDWIIAAVQNIRLFLRHTPQNPQANAGAGASAPESVVESRRRREIFIRRLAHALVRPFGQHARESCNRSGCRRHDILKRVFEAMVPGADVDAVARVVLPWLVDCSIDGGSGALLSVALQLTSYPV